MVVEDAVALRRTSAPEADVEPEPLESAALCRELAGAGLDGLGDATDPFGYVVSYKLKYCYAIWLVPSLLWL